MNNIASESEHLLCESIKLELKELAQFELKSKPKRQRKKLQINPVRKARMPKQRFNAVYSNLINGVPVITAPHQSESKRTCQRLILTELDCYNSQQDGVSPESTTRLMIEMRNAILKHDWQTLAKLIILFVDVGREKNRWYPTLLRYCMLALTRDPLVQGTGLLESFLEGVIGAHSDEEKDEFLSAIKKLPTNIYATKYNQLWEPPVDDAFISHPILQQLNDLLAKRCDDDSDESDGIEVSNIEMKADDSSDETVNDNMKILNLNSSLN